MSIARAGADKRLAEYGSSLNELDTQKQSVVDCSQCVGTGRYF